MNMAAPGLTRSIPACAGEPQILGVKIKTLKVYPRVCGGTPSRRGDTLMPSGLSPRVRGNHWGQNCPPDDAGSIPACAGEPGCRQLCPRGGRVYPRVCGGTQLGRRASPAPVGLSPRVRGNPNIPYIPPALNGSIPACAGEPRGVAPKENGYAVYPRVCGGTRQARLAAHKPGGLSPRVRGNPKILARLGGPIGSIPACAGEPGIGTLGGNAIGVYPRVCGGTGADLPGRAEGLGLSPRVRGNQLPVALYHARGQGLSPRVRGNPAAEHRAECDHRSIPACAGEPEPSLGEETADGVYPRVCGGTHCGRAGGGSGGRSIPACAGEPCRRRQCGRRPGVYPRVCGGTDPAPASYLAVIGLSPRVRGNLEALAGADVQARSIPACAGEPQGSTG